MSRKIRKKKSIQKRPVQVNVDSKYDRFKRFFKRFWIILASFISLAFTLWMADIPPRIRIDEIRRTGSDPFKHEFVVTNDGRLSAKHFTTKIKVDLIDEHKNKSESVKIDGFSPADSVEISRNQKVTFTLEKAFYFNNGWKVKDAVAKIFFSYTTFIGLPSYSDSVCYRTFPVGEELVWRDVGPSSQRLEK